LAAAAVRSFLKVDILNVMGLSMLGTALLWGLARRTVTRVVVLVTAAAATAMLTPDRSGDESARLAAGSHRGVLQTDRPIQWLYAASVGRFCSRWCGDRPLARYRS
jgi:hypothetical protein